MNKQELIRTLANKFSLPQKTVKSVLDTALEEIVLVMEEGEGYSHTGFGTFRTEISKERLSYNPAKKKRMILPKKNKVHFRPSSILKGKINE